MEYGHASIDPSYPHNSSMCKPRTGYLDSSSSPPETSAVSIIITLPSRRKEKDAELSSKERDSSYVEHRTWSFIKLISLAEIFVFVYHVIILANKGVTVDIEGPFYSEVKHNKPHLPIYSLVFIILILEPTDN